MPDSTVPDSTVPDSAMSDAAASDAASSTPAAPRSEHRSEPRSELPEATSHAVQITLITQNQCHLCDDARAVIHRVIDAGRDFTDIRLIETSLVDHPELAEQYAEFVPVVLVDGRQHATFSVREDRLAQAIVRARDERDRQGGAPQRPGPVRRLLRRLWK